MMSKDHFFHAIASKNVMEGRALSKKALKALTFGCLRVKMLWGQSAWLQSLLDQKAQSMPFLMLDKSSL